MNKQHDEHEPIPPAANEDGTWSFTDSRGFEHSGYATEEAAWQAYDEFNDEV